MSLLQHVGLLAQVGYAPEAERCAYLCKDTSVDCILWERLVKKRYGRVGKTRLGFAARQGQLDRVNFLLDNGADINALELYKYGKSPLMYAAEAGHAHVCEELLRRGADVTARRLDGRTAVCLARDSSHAAVVRCLCAQPRVQLAEAMVAAAQCGLADVVEDLLSRGASPDALDRLGHSALWAAAEAGHAAVVALLCAQPALPPVQAVLAAARCGLLDVLARMYSTAVASVAASTGQQDAQVEQEEEDEDEEEGSASAAEPVADPLQPRDADGRTPLMIASEHGHTACVAWLLSSSASGSAAVHSRSKGSGWTAAHYAARHGHFPALQALCDAGASVHATDTKGSTPLFVAAYAGCADCVRYLLSRGAAVEAPQRGGVTPLMMAAFRGHADTVQLLVQHGADMQARDDMGLRAVEWASKVCRVELVTYLLTQMEESEELAKAT